MAKYIISFNDERYDVVADTYNEARAKASGLNWSIYCAPDKDKKWRTGHPISGSCYVLHAGEPVRAEYLPELNCFKFVGYGGNLKSVHKTDGWLPNDWFRYVSADDADMRWWQEQDEYGDLDRYSYDPNEI